MRSPAISSATLARARALAADLDALARQVQGLFDDASAEAYARPAANDLDHLDALHDAAASAHNTGSRLRAAVGI